MKKSKILSSALVMGMVSFGAYAADEMITGGAGTCTADVLGVSADGATANTIAVWSINEYTLNPGEYLSVTATSVDKTTCPPGSYCVGGAGFTVDNAATSIEQCPTEYPNSAAGAGAQTQCYTACTVATANIAHATAVSGNDYFGDGVDACYATACDTGYHVDGDIELVENDPLIPVDYKTAGDDYAYIAQGDTASDADTAVGLSAQNTWAAIFDYGTVYGKASCQPTVSKASDYVYNYWRLVIEQEMSIEEFYAGLKQVASADKAELIADILYGIQNGINNEEDLEIALTSLFYVEYGVNYNTESVGTYCNCLMDGFAPIDTAKEEVLSAPWVYITKFASSENCGSGCVEYCVSYLTSDGDVSRKAVYGMLGYTQTGECTANTINIDWNPDNGGEHTKNMCTYDGEVTLPTPDPVKPGYTFTGWKLLEETTTE